MLKLITYMYIKIYFGKVFPRLTNHLMEEFENHTLAIFLFKNIFSCIHYHNKILLGYVRKPEMKIQKNA